MISYNVSYRDFVINDLQTHIFMNVDVVEYLQENFDVCELLLRVLPSLNDYFDDFQLYLEKEDEDIVWLYIVVNDLAEIALARLQHFDENFWLSNNCLANGKLCIDISVSLV